MSCRLQIEYILYIIKHGKIYTFTTSALWEAIFPETLKSENTSFVCLIYHYLLSIPVHCDGSHGNTTQNLPMWRIGHAGLGGVRL